MNTTLDSQSDTALRRDGATLALTFVGDDRETPPTIARIVRRHDGGSTVRVRVLGEMTTRLLTIRSLTSARAATRPEINAAITAVQSKTPEQTATASPATRSSLPVAVSPGAPTAPTAETESRAASDLDAAHVTSRPLVAVLGRDLVAGDSFEVVDRVRVWILDVSALDRTGGGTRSPSIEFGESVLAGDR